MPTPSTERGFTLVELLIGMTLTLVILAGALGVLQDAARASNDAAALTDVNQNIRVAMNVVIRDLVQAGEGDYSLRTGVSVPNGDGVDQIVRPSPDDTQWFFPAHYTVLPAVSTGNGIGPAVNGVATDVVTLLYEDRSLSFSGVVPNIPASGASMNLGNDFDTDRIADGDLIRFGNGAMQEVTNVAGNTVHFHQDAASNLNQRDAPEGSVMALKGESPTFPDLPVSRVLMITYYVSTPANGLPRLIRRVNYGPERVIAIGIENLQFSWDVVNGADNPTNVDSFADASEGLIRKANIFMSARSQATSASNGQPTRSSLTTQVSLRSMAFVSRYDLAQ